MLSALTRAARTGSSNNHPVDRRIQEVVLQPAGYTSVQRTDIVDAVEERSQVRFILFEPPGCCSWPTPFTGSLGLHSLVVLF